MVLSYKNTEHDEVCLGFIQDGCDLCEHTKTKLCCFKKKLKEVSFSVTYEELMCVPFFALHKSRPLFDVVESSKRSYLPQHVGDVVITPYIGERNLVFIVIWWSVTTHTQGSDNAFNLQRRKLSFLHKDSVCTAQ